VAPGAVFLRVRDSGRNPSKYLLDGSLRFARRDEEASPAMTFLFFPFLKICAYVFNTIGTNRFAAVFIHSEWFPANQTVGFCHCILPVRERFFVTACSSPCILIHFIYLLLALWPAFLLYEVPVLQH